VAERRRQSRQPVMLAIMSFTARCRFASSCNQRCPYFATATKRLS
jgi:hypothetical protein